MMTYDELLREFDNHSSHEPLTYLSNLLHKWKNDSTTVLELAERVDQFFDPVFLGHDAIASSLHERWKGFKSEVIEEIDGLTMNERLHWFGLFHRFENCATDDEQDVIYKKLLAVR